MLKYNKIINRSLKKKYSKSTIFNKNFLEEYKKQRLSLIRSASQQKHHINILNKKFDPTYEMLKKKIIFGITKKDEKEIVIFYKKFEINLKLKKNYDRNYKKLSNLETKYDTYIFLGLLVAKCKNLNFYQKINCILKIVDKLSTKLRNINKDNLILFIALLLIEKKLIKKII
tara:strand:- start:1344 stop:1859 length:516 start_codon:yes stop_codon:yes gene_type:complete